jgi:hypothetical protein
MGDLLLIAMAFMVLQCCPVHHHAPMQGYKIASFVVCALHVVGWSSSRAHAVAAFSL